MLVEKKFNYISKFKIIHTIFQEAVVKSCENDFSNTILVAKVKVEFHINHSIDSQYSTNSVNVYVPSDNQQFWYTIARGW